MELQVSLIDYVRPSEHEFLFSLPEERRTPLQPFSLNQRIPRLAKQAGIERRVTPTLLRDTCLTRVVAEKGMGAAMSLSGLSSQTLARYLPDDDEVATSDPRTRGLHHFVRADAEEKFLRGEYADAVEKAAKAVLQHLKNVSGMHDLDGDPLIRRVFGPDKGLLRLNRGRTRTDRDEAEGFMTMVAGFNMHVRNVHAHSHKVEMDEQRALEYITNASLICRIADRAVPRA